MRRGYVRTSVNCEALATTALRTYIWILKYERLGKLLFLKMNGCSIYQTQALRINKYVNAATLKYMIISLGLFCNINHISKAGTTGFSHAKPQSLTVSVRQITADSLRC